MIGSEQLEKEVQEVIEMQANLTDYQKALVEFMRRRTSICAASRTLVEICSRRFKKR